MQNPKHKIIVGSVDVYSFSGIKPGKHLLVFGAVHGNEVCGPIAIHRIIGEIRNGLISIESGTVTFVPVCNPGAYEKNERYVEENLNRVFYASDNGNSYEAGLARELTKLCDEADVLLDVHSYRAATPPFIMKDYDDTSLNPWINALSISNVVTGWADMYPEGGDTCNYMHIMGKTGLAAECGCHTDETAPQIAYNLIIETMAYFGIIAAPVRHCPEKSVCRMVELIMRPDETAELSRHWDNYALFSKGDVLYRSENGDYFAAFDGMVIMPKHGAEVGAEWFYTAKKCSTLDDV